jgi:nucleoid-associated protein YgaU
LIFLICGIFLYFILFPEKDKQFSTVTPLVENVTDSIPTDSAEKPVTIVEKPAPATKPVTNNVRRKLSVPFSQILVYADSTSYKITGTRARHTIKEGQTLIRISYRYYGTKDLWPYLVIHNRSVIKDPNLLPVGMAIDIPALKKK